MRNVLLFIPLEHLEAIIWSLIGLILMLLYLRKLGGLRGWERKREIERNTDRERKRGRNG